jgi:uncharacterized protein (TIGR00730 family)
MSKRVIKTLAVFCASRDGTKAEYTAAAQSLAQALCGAGITLVYGGAKVGLMGVLADRMLQLGGEVIGVIPQSLVDVELQHPDITQCYVVNSMHERKAKISELADGYIMLPGGFGTFEEFFEVITWAQLGFHQKPCGIFNVADYFQGLLAFIETSVAQEFIYADDAKRMLVADNAVNLLQQMQSYEVTAGSKWQGNKSDVNA